MYKFNVNPAPIALHTTAHGNRAGLMDPAPAIRERAYIQVQAHNISARAVVVEQVELESDAWEWHVIDAFEAKSTARHLSPKDVQQWVLVLTPRQPEAVQRATLDQLAAAPPEKRVVNVVHALGTLAVQWRVPGGETGITRIGPIQRTVSRTAAVPCGTSGQEPRLAVQALLQKPERAQALVPCTCTVRISLHDLQSTPTSEAQTYRLALMPNSGTWTDMQLLGPSTIRVEPDTDLALPVVPLHSGVVRSGGMALVLYGYTETMELDPPRVLREWPCFVELVVEEAD